VEWMMKVNDFPDCIASRKCFAEPTDLNAVGLIFINQLRTIQRNKQHKRLAINFYIRLKRVISVRTQNMKTTCILNFVPATMCFQIMVAKRCVKLHTLIDQRLIISIETLTK